jgi:hypothetical protein
MIQSIKKFLGIQPKVYDLPYNERVYITMLSTSIERVK